MNGQRLQITEAQAVIRNPNGEMETIDFPAGGTVAATWTPRQPGTHAVDLVVTARAPDGTSIERTDFLAIEVQPNPSKPQLTLNLALVIAGVLVLLGLLLYLIIRGIGRLIRRTRS